MASRLSQPQAPVKRPVLAVWTDVAGPDQECSSPARLETAHALDRADHRLGRGGAGQHHRAPRAARDPRQDRELAGREPRNQGAPAKTVAPSAAGGGLVLGRRPGALGHDRAAIRGHAPAPGRASAPEHPRDAGPGGARPRAGRSIAEGAQLPRSSTPRPARASPPRSIRSWVARSPARRWSRRRSGRKSGFRSWSAGAARG